MGMVNSRQMDVDRLPRIFPSAVLDSVKYVADVVADPATRRMLTCVVGETSMFLVPEGTRDMSGLKEVKLVNIVNVLSESLERNDIFTGAVGDEVYQQSRKIIVLYHKDAAAFRGPSPLTASRIEIVVWGKHSSLLFYHLHAAFVSAAIRHGLGLPIAFRMSGGEQTASIPDMYSEIEREIVTEEDPAQRGALVEELVQAGLHDREIKRCFFKSEFLVMYFMEQTTQLIKRKTKLSRPELAFVGQLFELMRSLCFNSQAVTERRQRLMFPRPYAFEDLLQVLITDFGKLDAKPKATQVKDVDDQPAGGGGSFDMMGDSDDSIDPIKAGTDAALLADIVVCQVELLLVLDDVVFAANAEAGPKGQVDELPVQLMRVEGVHERMATVMRHLLAAGLHRRPGTKTQRAIMVLRHCTLMQRLKTASHDGWERICDECYGLFRNVMTQDEWLTVISSKHFFYRLAMPLFRSFVEGTVVGKRLQIKQEYNTVVGVGRAMAKLKMGLVKKRQAASAGKKKKKEGKGGDDDEDDEDDEDGGGGGGGGGGRRPSLMRSLSKRFGTPTKGKKKGEGKTPESKSKSRRKSLFGKKDGASESKASKKKKSKKKSLKDRMRDDEDEEDEEDEDAAAKKTKTKKKKSGGGLAALKAKRKKEAAGDDDEEEEEEDTSSRRSKLAKLKKAKSKKGGGMSKLAALKAKKKG